MNESRWGWAFAALVIAGCGAPNISIVGDGGTSDHDTGAPPNDAAQTTDDGGSLVDAGPPVDSGPLVDSGVMPEECTGGVDEDGDRLIDCADDSCWAFDACIAADIAETSSDLVPCGDPIELDAAATAAACATIGTPDGSSFPTRCDVGTLEVSARMFCTAGGATAAVWIEERFDSPRTSRMLTPTTYEATRYERSFIGDWEQLGFAGGSTPSSVEVVHELSSGLTDVGHLRVITVRSVGPSDSLSRLLAVELVTSVIDITAGTSSDTRTSFRVGGVRMDLRAR